MSKKIERLSSSRALTRHLEQEGTRRIHVPGQRKSGDSLLAEMVWQYVINGQVTLPNGSILRATSREWITALKWLYGQIDGAPRPLPPEPQETIVRMEWVEPFEDEEDDDRDPDVITQPQVK